jgi:hypothetical protein
MKWLMTSFIICISVMVYADKVIYFPEGKFETISEIDNIVTEMYARYLSLLQEPSLWEISKKSEVEIYRFYKLNNKKNICIRVEITQSGYAVAYIKSLSEDSKKIVPNFKKNISQKYISDLKKKLIKVDFWRIKAKDYPALIEEEDGSFTTTLHGSTWVFEGIYKGKYQAFDILNPRDLRFSSHDMIELGNSFLQLETIGERIERDNPKAPE